MSRIIKALKLSPNIIFTIPFRLLSRVFFSTDSRESLRRWQGPKKYDFQDARMLTLGCDVELCCSLSHFARQTIFHCSSGSKKGFCETLNHAVCSFPWLFLSLSPYMLQSLEHGKITQDNVFLVRLMPCMLSLLNAHQKRTLSFMGAINSPASHDET
jgi:hypothetical protein